MYQLEPSFCPLQRHHQTHQVNRHRADHLYASLQTTHWFVRSHSRIVLQLGHCKCWALSAHPRSQTEGRHHRTLLSVDWHQVFLDCVRGSGGGLRPDTNIKGGYNLRQCICHSFQAVKMRIPIVVFLINSFCHNRYFPQSILSVQSHRSNQHCFDCTIVTSETEGRIGYVKRQSCNLIPIDYND